MIGEWNSRINYLKGKETPKCGSAPCLVCEVISRVKKYLGMG